MIISVHLNSSCGVAPHIGQECLPLHIMRYIMWVLYICAMESSLAEQPGNSGLPVAVVNTRTLQGVGEKIVVPDHKIYFAEFDDETTALYLCGLLTCSLVQKFIASFHIMIQVGDIFKHMRLPEFDERNHQHMHLVELVREAHNENDADVRNKFVDSNF